MDHCGILALDIDNTLTNAEHVVPKEVADYLKDMHDKGWYVFVLTGRSFTFAQHALEKFTFPYFLCTQNGAEGVSMPNKGVLFSHMLSKKMFAEILKITEPLNVECFVYAGYRNGDFCYYRKNQLSKELLDLASIMQGFSQKPWQEYYSLDDIKQESFPLVKCIADHDVLLEAKRHLSESEHFNLNLLSDVFKIHLSVLLATHHTASKGQALIRVKQHLSNDLPVIAAGDDENDLSLLHNANVKIAMENGNKILLREADIIAKPSTQLGIIDALEEAQSRLL